MSLFSTIAHPGAAETRRFSMKNVAVGAAAVVLGVVIGLAVAADRQTTSQAEAAQTAQVGLSHDAFVRLNTTDLEYPSLAASASMAKPAVAVDPFLYWNTTALDALAPAGSHGPGSDRVTERFWELNVTALEHPTAPQAERRNGPR